MTRTTSSFLALTAILLAPMAANADLITSSVGDEDCFGLGGICADGDKFVDLGGTFFADYRDAGDLASAPHTDYWNSPGVQSWTHNYVLTGGTPISASLDLFIAGVADIGPVSFFADNSLIATFDFPGLFDTAHFLTVAVPLVLIDGSTMFLIGPSEGDGYIIDYSTLRVETTTTSVPEPGTLALLGIGLLGMGMTRRKKKV
jgi:hypothetical protein